MVKWLGLWRRFRGNPNSKGEIIPSLMIWFLRASPDSGERRKAKLFHHIAPALTWKGTRSLLLSLETFWTTHILLALKKCVRKSFRGKKALPTKQSRMRSLGCRREKNKLTSSNSLLLQSPSAPIRTAGSCSSDTLQWRQQGTQVCRKTKRACSKATNPFKHLHTPTQCRGSRSSSKKSFNQQHGEQR